MRGESRTLLTVVAALSLLVVAPQIASAEHHEEASPTYTMIHYDTVGPANAPTYEENAKAWVAAFKDAGLDDEWGFQTYSGPNFTYAFLTDVPNYASLDSADERWAAMAEKIGQEKIDALSADGGGSSGHRHELTKDLPDLDYTPEGGVGEVGFVHLGTHYVKPGMGEQFRGLVKKVSEARKKAGSELAVRVSEVQFGNGSYHSATLAKDRGSYYSAKSVGAMLVEAYGEEEAQAMFDQWRECITDYKTSDWSFEPELSYMPGMYEEKEGMAEGE